MDTRKKKLTINTALCDMTRLSEESISAYDAIEINAAAIALSPRARELASRVSLAMNAAQIIQVEEGAAVSIKNGKAEITGDTAPAGPTLLIVNGRLLIHPGSEEALKGYAGISVNGKLLYPQSLGALLGKVQVNGLALSYPDDAVLTEGRLTVDELFVLRAKGSLYFVTGDVVMADESLDIKALAEKGTRFSAKNAYIAQKLLKDALPLFDDKARITSIPEGFAFVEEGNTLSAHLVSRFGKRLFIPGKFMIPGDQGDTLSQLEGLQVMGSIKLPEALLESLLALKPKYQKLIPYKGLLIADKSRLTISQALINQDPEGLTVEDCGVVSLDENISAREILDKLILRDCGAIRCHPGQETALLQVASDVGAITAGQTAESAEHEEKEDPFHEIINTAYYQF